MLELKHVSKIYQTGVAMQVKALDDINLVFDRTGLVFILGKSGSGKSTLLNVAGGLDEATTGEIVVMGKSSNDFSASDFDSYRNTYVGFVFQEYNVLQEFHVEDNIALALELQGKTKERARVHEILEEVELTGLEKRKPNTLSGGQKQRIAIARALVKDPQIIMADEPTGALDSATGKQMLETLQKLSRSRLVLVVSHDREAAEQYGDRIIELKDGKIISDVQKHAEQPSPLSENLTLIGADTLSVRQGAALTEEDVQALRSFVSQSEGNVILTRGKDEVAAFRKANRIAEDDCIDRFLPTQPPKKKDEQPSCRFIRSRLPLLRALRIGASGLKIKPFRLAMTILLSCISFTMFGLSSTLMLYDADATATASLLMGDSDLLTLKKFSTMTVTYDDMFGENLISTLGSALFSPQEVLALGGEQAVGAYTLDMTPSNVFIPDSEAGNAYYLFSQNKAVCVEKDSYFASKLLAGTLPAQEDEICVSSYFFEGAQLNALHVLDDELRPAAQAKHIAGYDDLIGERVLFGENAFRISGIFDSGSIPAKYDYLRERVHAAYDDGYASFRIYISENLPSCIFVHESFPELYLELEQDNAYWIDYGYTDYYYSYSIRGEDPDMLSLYNTATFVDYSQALFPERVHLFTGTEMTGSSAAISLYNLISTDYRANDVLSEQEYEDARNVIWQGEGPSAQRQAALNALSGYFAAIKPVLQLYTEEGATMQRPFATCEVVGFFDSYDDALYCSHELYAQFDIYDDGISYSTTYRPGEDDRYPCILVPFLHTREQLSPLMAQLGVHPEESIEYTLDSSLYASVNTCSMIILACSKIFLVIGCVFAVFSALLLFNFICVSISGKKREIGILRAVGARGMDVFKIFFSESGIIAGICFVISVALSAIFASLLNGLLASGLEIPIALFVFGPLSALFIAGIALLVALIGTFLPVFFAARKKPVESIRGL